MSESQRVKESDRRESDNQKIKYTDSQRVRKSQNERGGESIIQGVRK